MILLHLRRLGDQLIACLAYCHAYDHGFLIAIRCCLSLQIPPMYTQETGLQFVIGVW